MAGEGELMSDYDITKAFEVRKLRTLKFRKKIESTEVDIPSGVYKKCGSCSAILHECDVISSNFSCPRCGTYFRMRAVDRIVMITDPCTFAEIDETMQTLNPLEFPDYKEKLARDIEKTALNDAVITGTAFIDDIKIALAVMDSHFLMGSMGSVVGEKLTRLIEKATAEKLPLIIFCASGGARMQEGILSLMQMAKTSSALKSYAHCGCPYISVLTDPTTGGVTASFAMLGDYIFAEPKALIGFAGRRVVESTINQKLPNDFQSSETLLKNGFIDRIVPREKMQEELSYILKIHNSTEV